MNSVCRSCLSEEKPLAEIDDNFRSNYYLFTAIQIKLNDGLPQERCIDCAEMVASFLEFRSNCMLAENYLQQRIEKQPPVKLESKDELFEDSNDYNEHFLYALEEDTVALSKEVEIKLETKDDITDIPPKGGLKKSLRHRISNVEVKKNSRVTLTNKKNNTKSKRKEINNVLNFDTDVLGCGICKTSFKLDEDEQLKEHIESHKESRECEICLEGFTEWPQLVSHRIKHVTKKQSVCYICKKKVQNVYVMEHHYRKEHTDLNKNLKCTICMKEFERAESLKRHVVKHNRVTKQCPICKKSVLHIKTHMLIHGEDKAFSCKMCMFSAKTSSTLYYHIGREHGKIQCLKCKKFYNSQVSKDEHVCLVSKFICTICGKEILTKRKGEHMKTHEATPAYKCKFCPSVYKSRVSLSIHEDRHNKKPRHECEFCKRKFYARNCLLKHRRIHTGEKPYVCDICNKGFTAQHNLKVHMKVHGLDLVVKRNQEKVLDN